MAYGGVLRQRARRGMKKPVTTTLIAVTALMGLLLVGLALVPFLFRDRIVERLRTELNERLDATVTFSEIDVSLLSTFPTLTAEVADLAITGKGQFSETTLLAAKSIGAGVNLVALILDGTVELESIEMDRPVMHVRVGRDGKANYDIVPERKEKADTPRDAVAFEIKRYRITKGLITYDEPGVHIQVEGLQHDGRAKISGPTQHLSLETTADELTARVGGVTYLKKAKTSVALDATIETESEELNVHSLQAAVNQLAIEGSAKVGWANEGTDLDLQLTSKKGLPIKALISSIPNAYAADFAGLKASGAFSLEATVRGQLGPGDNDIPSFSVKGYVRDAALKYPDLPLDISDLNLDANVIHPGGNLDRARIEVPKFSIAAGKSHAKGHLTVTQSLSQPNIDLALDGRLDLAEIAKAYPIPDVEALEGLIAANIELKAKGERVEKLTGDITVADLVYRSADAPALRVLTARIELSPESTKLREFQAQVAESDL
ncbi:MAG: AsmA family protein, partial [Myxococcales bacterium]